LFFWLSLSLSFSLFFEDYIRDGHDFCPSLLSLFAAQDFFLNIYLAFFSFSLYSKVLWLFVVAFSNC